METPSFLRKRFAVSGNSTPAEMKLADHSPKSLRWGDKQSTTSLNAAFGGALRFDSPRLRAVSISFLFSAAGLGLTESRIYPTVKSHLEVIIPIAAKNS